jgi:hypothetical protein
MRTVTPVSSPRRSASRRWPPEERNRPRHGFPKLAVVAGTRAIAVRPHR